MMMMMMMMIIITIKNNNKMKGNVRGSLLKYHTEVQSIFYMKVPGRLSGPGAR
jgi:hypothetical protein